MRRFVCWISGALLLCGAGSTSALGAELTTTRIYRADGHGLRCSATNVGKKSLALVHMALIQGDASEIDPLGCEDLAPSATCEVSSADVPGGAYCRITFKGRAKAIRAMISAYDLATGQIVAIEPAR
jgi:hypothetical protein